MAQAAPPRQPAALPLHTELDTKPKAETLSVAELVFEQLRSGRIRQPGFQRGLRWNSADNIRLFDSILRGYPIGSLLLWKRPAAAGSVTIGAATLEVPERPDAFSVIDGQQRLTALGGALLPLSGQAEKYRVYIDLERLELRAGDDKRLNRDRALPLSTLADTALFRQWTRRHDDVSDALLEQLDRWAKSIREFVIPVYKVESEREEPLREIFTRMNSTGARMTAVEIFQALPGFGGQAKAFDLHGLCAIGTTRGFGNLDAAEVLKVVLALSEQDPTRRPEAIGREDRGKFVPAEEVAAALELTITFLTDEVDVPLYRVIPYPVAFTILARFFQVHPNPHAVTRGRLRRWFWRSANTGIHERAAVSRFREDLRIIKPSTDEHDTLDRLLQRIPPPRGGSIELRPFNALNAQSRIETLALLAEGPRHLPTLLGEEAIDGGPMTLEELREAPRPTVEIIAATQWRRLDEAAAKLAKTAANRALLHDRATGLAAPLRGLDPERDRGVLRSHLISDEAFIQLQDNQPGEFLKLRAIDVAAAVETFLSRRTEWDNPSIRPLHLYLGGDPLDLGSGE